MGAILLAAILGVLTPGALQAQQQTDYPGNPQLAPGGYFVAGQGLARFDPVSGALRWRVLTGQRLHEPVTAGGRILAAGEAGVFGVDAESGRVDWQRDLGSPAFSPVRDGESAFVAARDGRIWALAAASGRPLWVVRLGDGWIYPPAVADGLVITGGQDGMVWALDKVTGARRWQRHLGQELVYRPISVGDHLVVVTTYSGEVIALDSASGELRWQARFVTASLSPVGAGGRLLLPGMDGVLRAVDPSGGGLLWQRPLGGRLAVSLVERDGVLLALTDNGEGLLLDAEDGAVIQHSRTPGDPVAAVLVSASEAIVFVTSRNNPGTAPVMLHVF